MIQSLLTQEEYNTLSKRYKTYNPKFRKYTTPFREMDIGGRTVICGPPPCYQMGDRLSGMEILYFNSEIDKLMKKVAI